MVRKNKIIYIIFILSAPLIMIKSIIWALVTGSAEKHNDAINYYNGFIEASNNLLELNLVWGYFGHFPEIILPIIYHLISYVYIPKNVEEMILVNAIVFSVSITIALMLYLKRLSIKETGGLELYYASFIVISSVIPPGLGMQLSRQAIAYALILGIAGITLKLSYRKQMLFLVLITPLMHIGLLISTYLMANLNGMRIKKIIILIAIILGLGMFDLINKTTGLSYKELAFSFESVVFSNKILVAVLMLALFYSIKTLKIKKNIIWVALIVEVFFIGYSSEYFTKRALFGLDFFILPVLLIYLFNKIDYKQSFNKIFQASFFMFVLSNFGYLYLIMIG